MPDVQRRFVSALISLAERHDGRSAVAVSHEIPIRLVVARPASIKGPAFWDVDLPTGSVTAVRFENRSLSLAGEVRMQAVPRSFRENQPVRFRQSLEVSSTEDEEAEHSG